MPELPEVETVKRGLEEAICHRQISSIWRSDKRLRFDDPVGLSHRTKGAFITRLSRRAKYLLIHLDNGFVFLWHLGMSGRFCVRSDANQPRNKHEHVRFFFRDGWILTYDDPRRFGFFDLVEESELERHPRLIKLGKEPFDVDLKSVVAQMNFSGRTQTLKQFLLDQRTIAGIGNIYASEILFKARISPFSEVQQLPKDSWDKLTDATVAILSRAIEAGGSSLKDHQQVDGNLGYFQHQFSVYGREGDECLSSSCNASISKGFQNGRSTFFCPECQPFFDDQLTGKSGP